MLNGLTPDLGAIQLLATAGEILFFVAFGGAFAMFFIVAIGNRSDADPTGSRPIAAYLFSGAFLFLWTAYFGIAAAAFSIINLIGSHPTQFVPVSYGNEAIRACVLGALLVLIAGGVGYLHLRRGNQLAEAEADPSGPTKRVMRSYVALVSFVSVLIVVFDLVVALWLLLGLISPTIFLASSSRVVTGRALLDALVLVAIGGGIFLFHQRLAPSSLRTLASAPRLRGTHAVQTPTPPVE